MVVTTAHILADRALQRLCDKTCVDWAIGLLENGATSDSVCRLAAQLPLYNHFELASLRDHILSDLGLLDVSIDEALIMYSAELLEAAASGSLDMDEAIAEVKDLCIANDYQSELYDFYALHFARLDLREQAGQYYVPGANQSNIDLVTRQLIDAFITKQRHRRRPKR